jgi:tRNA nucleotidyltransferase/poly(A) polymerase
MRSSDAAAAIGMDKEPLSRVLALLDTDGEEARVIGGAVRNALMGLPVGEVDIATTATPQEVTRRSVEAGLKAVPTGIEHGTVTVIVSGAPFEVTTLREDIETYGRKAKVAFGRDWAADAKRRDFTINALSASRDGTIHDYVDGLRDIEARRVRFVGEPATRIAEDYLRILRFFRFHAAYGRGDLDPVGLHACIAGRAGLDTLSRERVRMELLKLLAALRAAETFTVMSDTGILQNLLGGIGRVTSFADMVAVEAVIGARRDPVRGLGALGVYVTEDAGRLRHKLRLTNAEGARLESMADGWWRIDPSMGEMAAKVLLYHLGPAHFFDRAMLAWARANAEASDPRWRDLATLPERWTAPVFPLKAADFIARGVEKGPLMGKALAHAEAVWIAAGFPSDNADVQIIADRAARTVV